MDGHRGPFEPIEIEWYIPFSLVTRYTATRTPYWRGDGVLGAYYRGVGVTKDDYLTLDLMCQV